jgi:hypothetical protein
MKYDITVQEVECLPYASYRVGVYGLADGKIVTEHIVRLSQSYLDSLGFSAERASELIRISFQFLLEREAPSAILKEFDLQLIQDYFNEYEEEMKKW